MNVAFVDPGDLRYRLDTLDAGPLGGSQSAMILVATELARRGVEVFLVGMHLPHGESCRGVTSLNLYSLERRQLAAVDVVVTLNEVLPQQVIRSLFLGQPRLVHWHRNDARSLDAKKFADRTFYEHVDHLVFCSHFQANSFISLYGLPYDRVSVIPNPISPPFCNLFAPDEPVLARKDPDLLVYASAPNRGLEELARVILPALRQARPSLRLAVFSGFYLDQGQGYANEGTDRSEHCRALLAMLESTAGVTAERGIAKPVLAQRFRRAAMLCYPCSFRETSCTVALEAMAAGCLLSVPAMGALTETTARFAHVTSLVAPDSFSMKAFVATTLNALAARDREPAAIEQQLRLQVDHVNHCHSPAIIAGLWRDLLHA